MTPATPLPPEAIEAAADALFRKTFEAHLPEDAVSGSQELLPYAKAALEAALPFILKRDEIEVTKIHNNLWQAICWGRPARYKNNCKGYRSEVLVAICEAFQKLYIQKAPPQIEPPGGGE